EGLGGGHGLVLEEDVAAGARYILDDLEDVAHPIGRVGPGAVPDAGRVAGDADRRRDVAAFEESRLGAAAAQSERGERSGGQVGGGGDDALHPTRRGDGQARLAIGEVM